MKWHLSYASYVQITQDSNVDASSLDSDWLNSLSWKSTNVPSSVQNSEFGLPVEQLYTLDHIHRVEWMREQYWFYRTTFVMPDVGNDDEVIVRFCGVDYSYSIYVNSALVCQHEGMFSLVEIVLTDLQVGSMNELVVVIDPFVRGEQPYEQLKARYSMGNGWDFAPKLQSIGIWDEVDVHVRKKLRIEHATVTTKVANQQRADTIIHINLSEYVDYGHVSVELQGIRRTYPIVQTNRLALPFVVPSPQLWWPNGMGNAHMVELKIELVVDGRITETYIQQVGLRSVAKQACQGQGVMDIPLQLVINNHKVFIKGVNWVPLDACPGTITAERYRTYLQQFREAGVNLVRVWGGGLKEKDAFYRLADEYGLMIMQEFSLACQDLARTERFYRLLVQECTAIIQSLKHHPSVVIWTGGNEHYHYWDNVDSGSTVMNEAKPIVQKLFKIDEDNREWRAGADSENEPSLGLMGHLCALLDDSRPYHITSGMEGQGEVHGIWNWNPKIGDHRYRDYKSLYDFWRDTDQHLYSEASVSSIANLETIRKVFATNDPPYPDSHHPIWRLHHAFHAAWDELRDIWLDMPSTERLFGKLDKLDDVVFANQWMQGEGGRFLIEEIRRKTGHTSGVIWWGVNEPWPGLAGNALIDYYGKPKIGWKFLANAYRPTILSLRYEHCIARSVKPELWVSHDGNETFRGYYVVMVNNLLTGEVEKVEGQVECHSYASVYIRLLPRHRLTAGVKLQVRCQLYTVNQGNLLHQNDYFFGSNEDVAPLGGKMIEQMRIVCDAQ